MCQFNLQRTFPGLCPFTENFKDQRRAVNHFQIKRLFQIALLDRGQGSIDDQQFDPAGGGRFAKTSDHPFAEISVGTNLPQPNNFGKCHLQIDRRRQPDGFLQPLLRIKGSFFTRRFRINDAGFYRRNFKYVFRQDLLFVGFGGNVNRHPGHDGRNRMFVNQLGVSVAAQQDGGVVKPGNDPLQLNAVDEENGYCNFVFPDIA